ncbi:MAG: hypothetical protein IPL73_10985 [Candidatus Obscuribacter sp.]|nr:hypothetical protein [Candidatus Obscuribacter sp.]
MAGNELALDAPVEQRKTHKVADTPLVSNEDMKNFAGANSGATFGGKSIEFGAADKSDGEANEPLDFSQHPLAKFDQCGPDRENIGNDRNIVYWPTEKGEAFEQAAEQMLNGPERQAKKDLSPEDNKSADDVAANVKDFFNSSDAATKNSGTDSFLANLDRMSDAREKLGETLSGMAPEKMDDVIAAANEKLKPEGMRIERLPDTDEVWMKQSKPGQPDSIVFAKKGFLSN